MRGELLTLLNSLSAEELDEARTYIEYRTSKSTSGEVTPRDYRYWQAMCYAMEGYGAGKDEHSFRDFIGGGTRKGFGVRAWNNAVARLEAYIDHGCGKNISRLERQHVARECFSALVTRARQVGAPVTPQVIMQHMVSLETAMEYVYPGYYRAGLLRMIATGGANESAS